MRTLHRAGALTGALVSLQNVSWGTWGTMRVADSLAAILRLQASVAV